MYTDSRKIQLIEEVLREENDSVLKAIEAILKKSKRPVQKKKGSAFDFVGLWSKKEGDLIEKIIDEDCELINPNDWK
jgi:hypothetical protein